MAGSHILIYLLKEFRSISAGMYTNSSRSYLKMASGTPRRTNGTPWRTGGTPTAEYSVAPKNFSDLLFKIDHNKSSLLTIGVVPLLTGGASNF
jgi:hypothetical protein